MEDTQAVCVSGRGRPRGTQGHPDLINRRVHQA